MDPGAFFYRAEYKNYSSGTVNFCEKGTFEFVEQSVVGRGRNAVADSYLQHVSRLNVSDLQILMEQYGEDVWNYAYFLTKNTHHADDIAQEVFMKVYHNVHTFRGEASEKTWLLKITRNTAYSFLKLAFFRKVTLMDSRTFQNVFSPGAVSPSAEQQYMEKEAVDTIWNSVLELPRKFRDPFVLSLHYGLPLEAIAGILGQPVGTVKSRIYRAKKRLAEKLKGGIDDGGVENRME